MRRPADEAAVTYPPRSSIVAPMGLLILPTENNNNKVANKKTSKNKTTSNVSKTGRSIQLRKRNISKKAIAARATAIEAPTTRLTCPKEHEGVVAAEEFTYIAEDSGLGADIIMNTGSASDKAEAQSQSKLVEGQTVLSEDAEDEEVEKAEDDAQQERQTVPAPYIDAALHGAEQTKEVAPEDRPLTPAVLPHQMHYERSSCLPPSWCHQPSDAPLMMPDQPPLSPGKRKIADFISADDTDEEEEKRRRLDGRSSSGKTPLEELSELGSRAVPEQFSSTATAGAVMHQTASAAFGFEATCSDGNGLDDTQDFGADGFDSDSMDSDESDSSLPSDEESDSEVDSDSAEWFESGPSPRIDEEMCRKNWNVAPTQNSVYASKSAQCWGDRMRGGPESCGKPNCPCGDELFLRRRNAYHRRRQVVFNLSVSKLGRYRQAANPSLLRSVLVCNTLRNLEKEFEKEGVRFSVGAHGNLVITRSCPPNHRNHGNNNHCGNNSNIRPMPTWSQRRMMRQAAHGGPQAGPQMGPDASQQPYQWQGHPGSNTRDCGSCGNCLNCANNHHMRSSHCFMCGKPHSVCRNSCRSQDYRGQQQQQQQQTENGWAQSSGSEYRQSDYDYWQRCRYRRPGFNRWPSPTPRYPADYKERGAYRDYREDYSAEHQQQQQQHQQAANGRQQMHGSGPSAQHQSGQQHMQHRDHGFQGYHESDWTQQHHQQQQQQSGQLHQTGSHYNNVRYPARDLRAGCSQGNREPLMCQTNGVEDRSVAGGYGTGFHRESHASSVLFADLNEDSGRLTPFVAFRDEPLTDYDTVDRLLNSVSVLNFGNTVPVATPVATEESSESSMANSQLLTLTAPWKSPPHPEGSHSQDGQAGGHSSASANSATSSISSSASSEDAPSQQMQHQANRGSPNNSENQLITLTTPWKSPPHDAAAASNGNPEGATIQFNSPSAASAKTSSDDTTYCGELSSHQSGNGASAVDRYTDLYGAKSSAALPAAGVLQPSSYQDFQQAAYPLQDMTPRYGGNCKDSWEAEWSQEWPSYWGMMPDEGRSVLAS